MMTERVGQQLGNYRLLRLLGQGGFGEVYLGEHIYLTTQAAIKVLHVRLDQEDIEDFLHESRTIAGLKHAHIVRVLDFGIDGGTPFLVMDYASGGTLRQRYPKGSQLSLSTIASYVKQVAQALQYAHERKFVHRDIKPDNLFFGENSEVLLGDFGIATMAQSSHLQNTQEVIGTVAYMAPEQLQGKPRPASDQYSLGIVVYEWLCGDRPFHGTFTELYSQHMFVPPPPLREKAPTVPADVERVVRTALEKDPKRRFDTVQTFATTFAQIVGTDVSSLLADESLSRERVTYPSANQTSQTPATPVGTDVSRLLDGETTPEGQVTDSITPFSTQTMDEIQPPQETVHSSQPSSVETKPARRHRPSWGKVALFAALVLFVVGSSGLIYATVRNSKPQPTVRVPSAYDTAVAAHGVMKGFNVLHTGTNPYEHILSPTTVSKLAQHWVSSAIGVIGYSSPIVANGVVYVGSWDHNFYALDATNGTKLWSFSTGDQIYSTPAVANGVVYVGSDDNNLYALDARTGVKLWTFSTGNDIDSSPTVANGVVYLSSWDNNLYALDARSGTKLWTFPTGAHITSSPAIARGVVYIGSFDKNVYAVDARTGTKLWTFSTGNAIYSSPAVVNGVVYIGSKDKNVYALNAKTGAKLWTFSTRDYIYSSPAVANGVVYIGSDDHNLYALHARTGAKLWDFPTGNYVRSSPTLANGVVYIGSWDYSFYALDASSGAKRWDFVAGDRIESTPAVANGMVYVGSFDYKLYAFGLAT